MSISAEYKASIPLRFCKIAWLVFVFGSLASYVLGDWLVYCMLAWFAFWEGYGILTPRPGDTYSEANWRFTADKPARLGLTLGMVGFFFMTLVRLAYEVVWPDGPWVDELKFSAALAFLVLAAGWLGLHFVKLGKLG